MLGQRPQQEQRRLGVVVAGSAKPRLAVLSLLFLLALLLPITVPVGFPALAAAAAPMMPDPGATTGTPDRVCAPPAFGLWRLWAWRDGLTRSVTASEPCALMVNNQRARPGAGALTITVAFAHVADGASASAAVALIDAAGTPTVTAIPLSGQRRRSVGTFVIPDFGRSVKSAVISGRLSGEGSADCAITVSFAPAPAGASPDASSQAASAAGARVLSPLNGVAPPAPGAGPRIDVRRVTRQTSARQEDRTCHACWLWSFGDGFVDADDDPRHTTVTRTHIYLLPGVYRAVARSISNKGDLLRELAWTTIVPPTPAGGVPIPVIQSFSAETIAEPKVGIELTGPHKWVTGRPAEYMVRVSVSAVPHCERQAVLVDPGREFAVTWERAGTYLVRVAAVVHLRYEFPERVISIVNTYVREQRVEVFATVVSD